MRNFCFSVFNGDQFVNSTHRPHIDIECYSAQIFQPLFDDFAVAVVILRPVGIQDWLSPYNI